MKGEAMRLRAMLLLITLLAVGCDVPVTTDTPQGRYVNSFHVFDYRAGQCIHVTTSAIDTRLQYFQVVPSSDCGARPDQPTTGARTR